MADANRIGIPSWLATIGLVVATVLVIALAAQLRTARAEIGELRTGALMPALGSLTPVFHTRTLGGDSISLGPTDAAAQIYFVYNTTCPYCIPSLEAWNSLAARFNDVANVRVIGIGLDEEAALQKYHAVHELGFDGIPLTDARWRDGYRLGAVPQTLVLDGEGRILRARAGPLRGRPAVDSIVGLVDRLVSNAGTATGTAVSGAGGRVVVGS